jgi:hypothetical protein
MLHQGKIPAACFRAISQKDRCNFTNDFSNRFSVGKNIEIPTSSVLTCIRDRARSVRTTRHYIVHYCTDISLFPFHAAFLSF